MEAIRAGPRGVSLDGLDAVPAQCPTVVAATAGTVARAVVRDHTTTDDLGDVVWLVRDL
jgi:hypothetical protein